MEREYVAIATNSGQISQDKWDTWDEVFKMTDATTIGELREWYLKKFWLHELDKDKVKINSVRIAQIE